MNAAENTQPKYAMSGTAKTALGIGLSVAGIVGLGCLAHEYPAETLLTMGGVAFGASGGMGIGWVVGIFSEQDTFLLSCKTALGGAVAVGIAAAAYVCTHELKKDAETPTTPSSNHATAKLVNPFNQTAAQIIGGKTNVTVFSPKLQLGM